MQMLAFDDHGNPETAAAKATDVAASPAVAVIGHFSGATLVAGGSVYKQAQVPAVTASANAPLVTANNPYYFRVTNDTSTSGHTLAAYTAKVLGKKHTSVLYTDEAYGRSLRASFADEYADQDGVVDEKWAWNLKWSRQEHEALIRQVSQSIANGEGGAILLAMSPFSEAQEALTLLRRTGVNPVVLGGTALGNDFPKLFAGEPEEKREPDFFTDNLYPASPIIYDSASGRALTFSDSYLKTFHSYADERADKHYDAATLLIQAIRQADIQGTAKSRDEDRRHQGLAGSADRPGTGGCRADRADLLRRNEVVTEPHPRRSLCGGPSNFGSRATGGRSQCCPG